MAVECAEGMDDSGASDDADASTAKICTDASDDAVYSRAPSAEKPTERTDDVCGHRVSSREGGEK